MNHRTVRLHRRMRRALSAMAFVTAVLGASAAVAAPVTVYKTATCGCCEGWVTQMRESGFEVAANDVTQARLHEIKRAAGIGRDTASCHTAFIGDYVIEGHVPARDVRRMLMDEPTGVRGLAVPGMPLGAPGMEVPGRSERYRVLALDGDGGTRVYATHGLR